MNNAASTIRDAVEKGLAENKALFDALDAKLNEFIRGQEEIRGEIKDIKASQPLLFCMSAIISICIIGIAAVYYIGLSQIAAGIARTSGL